MRLLPSSKLVSISLLLGLDRRLHGGDGKEARDGDKDAEGVLRILAPHVSRGLAVTTNNPRSLPAEETAARMRAAGIEGESCGSLAAALSRSREKGGEPTLVCGSLFLAGESIVALGAYPWGDASVADPSEMLRPLDDTRCVK